MLLCVLVHINNALFVFAGVSESEMSGCVGVRRGRMSQQMQRSRGESAEVFSSW